MFSTLQTCIPHNLYLTKAPDNSKLWHSEGIILWAQLPVRVFNKIPEAYIEEDTSKAVLFWNETIGCEIFSRSTNIDSEVIISFRAPFEGKNWAASSRNAVRRPKKGEKYWGNDIYVHHILPDDHKLSKNMMSHELGHVLGLKDLHSLEDKNSIMYWRLGNSMNVDARTVVTLRGLYCP